MGLLGKAAKGAPGNDRLTEHPGSLHLQSFTRRKLGLIVTREKWDFPFPQGTAADAHQPLPSWGTVACSKVSGSKFPTPTHTQLTTETTSPPQPGQFYLIQADPTSATQKPPQSGCHRAKQPNVIRASGTQEDH